MLVLTRKKSESIQIGEDIVIKIVQTGKGTVKIGIEAPAHVRVLRGELSSANTTEVAPQTTVAATVKVEAPVPVAPKIAAPVRRPAVTSSASEKNSQDLPSERLKLMIRNMSNAMPLRAPMSAR